MHVRALPVWVLGKNTCVQFAYVLTGPGWAEATIAAAGEVARMSPSYVTDALGDLVRVAVRLLRGSAHDRMNWENEPGDVRWEFSRDGSAVRVRIGMYEDENADEPAQKLFDATVGVREFAESIAVAAKQIRDAVGEDGYLERWVRHPFPTHELHKLDRILSGADNFAMSARFGTDIDNVSLWLYDTDHAAESLECDLKVETGRFTATVTGRVGRRELKAFEHELHAVSARTASKATLATVNGECQVVILDSWEVSGTISDGPQRTVHFTIPCHESDIDFAARTFASIIGAVNLTV